MNLVVPLGREHGAALLRQGMSYGGTRRDLPSATITLKGNISQAGNISHAHWHGWDACKCRESGANTLHYINCPFAHIVQMSVWKRDRASLWWRWNARKTPRARSVSVTEAVCGGWLTSESSSDWTVRRSQLTGYTENTWKTWRPHSNWKLW